MSNLAKKEYSIRFGSLTTLLTVLFVGLKLGHVIDWPWIWVLSPLWISALITIGVILLIFLFVLVLAIIVEKG